MKVALVSIITPTYNSARFIVETIQSVQHQTYANWEMVVIDDCSADNTVDIVSSIAAHDPRIKLFQLKQNSGTGVARNFGTQKASGQYIAFLDSDDLWLPEKLAAQLDFMQSHNQPFTFSFYDCIDESGAPLNRRIEAPKVLTYDNLFWCNWVGNLTGIYNVDHFGKIEIRNVRKRQDWILWLTILKQMGTAIPVQKSLALYRIRQNSVSASKWPLLKHNFLVYKNFHNKNMLIAFVCVIGFLVTQFLDRPGYVKKIN